MKFNNALAECNKIRPLQNPRYTDSEDILKNKVSDKTNKVIGKVDDVLFSARDGSVTAFYVDFDRLNMRQSVYLNLENIDIGSVSSGYRLSFVSDEIEALYPQLLSNIETAAGEVDDDGEKTILSLNNILGSKVTSSDGHVLGEIQDVLFDNHGKFVQSIYLNISYGTTRNKGIAVPLSAFSFTDNSRAPITVDEKYANSIIKMAKDG